jgi:pimeloyl-ACP methyl ester carboxylesterase
MSTRRLEVREFALRKGGRARAYVADASTGEALCDHIFEDATRLEHELAAVSYAGCPACRQRVGGAIRGPEGDSPALPGHFGALNTAPDLNIGHHHDARLDHELEVFDGIMGWRPSAFALGADGAVDRSKRYYGRCDISATPTLADGYGVPLDRMKTRGIDGSMPGNELEIAYTVFMPKSRAFDTRGNDDLPLVLMLHGVPTNRKWKVRVARQMAAAGAIVVTADMLGMGESSMALNYHFPGLTAEANEGYLWRFDVEYLRKLMLRHVPGLRQVNRARNLPFVLSADDWGGGIAKWYHAMYSHTLKHLILVNPIYGKGYFVIEIGTIGKMAMLTDVQFMQGAFALPQAIIGILKYMVEERWRMNRWTETSFMFPYQDVDYTAGKRATEMGQHFWNMRVLAARASWLAPSQLQPFDAGTNPRGIHYHRGTAPVHVIWGMKDQMMPPSQVFDARYRFYNSDLVTWTLIEGANHFSEIDRPDAVVNATIGAMLSADITAFPVFLGTGDDLVWEGSEHAMTKALADLFPAAPRV